MKVVYFGTAGFAVPALAKIAEHCVAVVTQPAKPSGRGLKVQPTPVQAKAMELGIPVLAPAKARSQSFIDELRALEADIFIVAAYGQILRKVVLDIPPCGCFNLHGSILPRWRGAAPIQRAIEAGDQTTGITLMQMDEGCDTGPMIAFGETEIGPDELADSMTHRLSEIAADMIGEWLPRLFKGDFEAIPQNSELSTHAAKIERADTFLLANHTASSAYNRFRAFSPRPGVGIETPRGVLKVKHCTIDTNRTGEPGRILATQPELVVAMQDQALILQEVQPEGKRAMKGSEFANGARFRTGDCLFQ